MNWDFIANTPSELAKIGNLLIKARRSAFLYEQWQMSRLIEAASSASIFEFPFHIRHTGEKGVPDFQIKSGERQIAVELAIISTQDLECARGLQKRTKGKIERAMDTSNLLRKKSLPRTVDEIIADAFAAPTWVFGMSYEEHEEIWIKEVKKQLDEKTTTLQDERFEHGDEDWLCLWDRIGTPEIEVNNYFEIVKKVLASFWKPEWYSRVLIQQTDFNPYLAVFTPTSSDLIQNLESATRKYPPGFIFSGSPDE